MSENSEIYKSELEKIIDRIEYQSKYGSLDAIPQPDPDWPERSIRKEWNESAWNNMVKNRIDDARKKGNLSDDDVTKLEEITLKLTKEKIERGEIIASPPDEIDPEKEAQIEEMRMEGIRKRAESRKRK